MTPKPLAAQRRAFTPELDKSCRLAASRFIKKCGGREFETYDDILQDARAIALFKPWKSEPTNSKALFHKIYFALIDKYRSGTSSRACKASGRNPVKIFPFADMRLNDPRCCAFLDVSSVGDYNRERYEDMIASRKAREEWEREQKIERADLVSYETQNENGTRVKREVSTVAVDRIRDRAFRDLTPIEREYTSRLIEGENAHRIARSAGVAYGKVWIVLDRFKKRVRSEIESFA